MAGEEEYSVGGFNCFYFVLYYEKKIIQLIAGGKGVKEMYITNVTIESVRHLHNIELPLSDNHRKNLIITGKNGSGKTSLLEAMSKYLEKAATDNDFNKYCESLKEIGRASCRERV